MMEAREDGRRETDQMPDRDERGPSDPDYGDDAADDTGDELEAMIERADRPFASESFGTTATEELGGESLDDKLAEERPDKLPVEDDLAIEEADVPDDEPELIGEASVEHDPFAAPEEAAMTVRDTAPGGTDHAGDEYVELYDESAEQD
jgi:hypothetical protein